MANSDFISNLHKGFNFPLDTLREFIQANTNIEISDFIKITMGYESEVYEMGQYMVKICRDGDVSYPCVMWAVNKCKEMGVKVPNIVYCGKIDGLDIMIEEKIDGPPLTPDLYEEAGAELKKIHQIKVDGFWRRHEDGSFDFTNYIDIARSSTCDRLSEMPLICAGNKFDTKDIDKMEKFLRQAEDYDVEPVLNHGDYAPKHILCGESINGIIDFGGFHGGSIYSDLAYFSLNSDEKYFGEFLKGYGEVDGEMLLGAKVISLMGYLAHSRKIGDDVDANKLELQLAGLLS